MVSNAAVLTQVNMVEGVDHMVLEADRKDRDEVGTFAHHHPRFEGVDRGQQFGEDAGDISTPVERCGKDRAVEFDGVGEMRARARNVALMHRLEERGEMVFARHPAPPE
ncbi:hypothetical protein MRBLRH8O_002619 [Agrobacterium radiobacter]|uniref:hypothetical protein n=1 Tax=Agrobacterium radiobacter TaxID=362 RepID=UPI000DCFBEA4